MVINKNLREEHKMFGFIKKLFGATPVEKKAEECPVMSAPYKVEAAPAPEPTPAVEAAPAKKAPAKKAPAKTAPAKKPAAKKPGIAKPKAPRKPKAKPAK